MKLHITLIFLLSIQVFCEDKATANVAVLATVDPAVGMSGKSEGLSIARPTAEVPEGYPKEKGQIRKCTEEDRSKEKINPVLHSIWGHSLCGKRKADTCGESKGVSCFLPFYNYYEPCLNPDIESYSYGECIFETYNCTDADRLAGCKANSDGFFQQVCGIRSNNEKCKDNDKLYGCRDNFENKACACGKSDIVKVEMNSCPWESMYNPYEWACSPEEQSNTQPCSEESQGPFCANYLECQAGECYKTYKNRCEMCKNKKVSNFYQGECQDQLYYYNCSTYDKEEWQCDEVPSNNPDIWEYPAYPEVRPVEGVINSKPAIEPAIAVAAPDSKPLDTNMTSLPVYDEKRYQPTRKPNPVKGVCGFANQPNSQFIDNPYKSEKFINICKACKMPNLAWLNFGDCPPPPPRHVVCEEFLKTANCSDPQSEESLKKVDTCGYKNNNFNQEWWNHCYGNECMKSFSNLCEACSAKRTDGKPLVATAQENQCYFQNRAWERYNCKEVKEQEANKIINQTQQVKEFMPMAANSNKSSVSAGFAPSTKPGMPNSGSVGADSNMVIKTPDADLNLISLLGKKLVCDTNFDRKVCGYRKNCDRTKEICFKTYENKCDACNLEDIVEITPEECPEIITCSSNDRNAICPAIYEGVCAIKDLETCKGGKDCVYETGTVCQACSEEGVKKVMKSPSCMNFFPEFNDYSSNLGDDIYYIFNNQARPEFSPAALSGAAGGGATATATPPTNPTPTPTDADAAVKTDESTQKSTIYECTEKDRSATCNSDFEGDSGVCGYKKSGCKENCYITSPNKCKACANKDNVVQFVTENSCEKIIASRISLNGSNNQQLANVKLESTSDAGTNNKSENTITAAPTTQSDTNNSSIIDAYRCTDEDRKAICTTEAKNVCGYKTCSSGVCPFSVSNKCVACNDKNTEYVVEAECKVVGLRRIAVKCQSSERSVVCTETKAKTYCGKYSSSSKFCASESCSKNFDSKCSACSDADVEVFMEGDCDDKVYKSQVATVGASMYSLAKLALVAIVVVFLG